MKKTQPPKVQMTNQNQTRIVLDEAHRPKAEEIMKATGISSFSQLFSLFIVNYGDHLVSALKYPPGQLPYTHVVPNHAVSNEVQTQKQDAPLGFQP
jgi:hypothetical protein